MLNFVLGFSITLNILFIIIFILLIKIIKKKKEIFNMNDCIVDKEAFNDFFNTSRWGYEK